ncbi:hypothetical protein HDV01_004198 [Terramyces sp. JEL0728]|nr:hypothetical protein HDV01_004198 [Terramyces sp. JEL0728]
MNLQEIIQCIGDRQEMKIGEFLELTLIDTNTFPEDPNMVFPVATLVEVYRNFLESMEKKESDQILDGSFLFNSLTEISKKDLFAESDDPVQESLQLEGRLGELQNNEDDFPHSSIFADYKEKKFILDKEFRDFGQESPARISFGNDIPLDSPAKISFGNDVPQDSPKFSFSKEDPGESKLVESTFNFGKGDPLELKHSRQDPKFTFSNNVPEKSGNFSFGTDIPQESPVKLAERESRFSFQKELEGDSFFQKKDSKKLEASYFIANNQSPAEEFGSTSGFQTPEKKGLSNVSKDEFMKFLSTPVKEQEWEIKKHYVNILDTPGTFEKSVENLHSKIPIRADESMSLLENESVGNLAGLKNTSRIAILKKNTISGSPLKNEYKSILERSKIPSPVVEKSPANDDKENQSPFLNNSPLSLKDNRSLLAVKDQNSLVKSILGTEEALGVRDTSNLIGSPIVLVNAEASNLIGSPLVKDTRKLIASPLANILSKNETNLLDISNVEVMFTPSKYEKELKSHIPVLSPKFQNGSLDDVKELARSPIKYTESPRDMHLVHGDLEKESHGDFVEHDTSMNIGELNELRKSHDPIPPSSKADIVATNPFEQDNTDLKLDKELLKLNQSVLEERGLAEDIKDPKKLVYQVSKPISPRHMNAFRRKYSNEIDIPAENTDLRKVDNRRESKSFAENHSQQFKDKIEYWKQTEQEVIPDNLSQSSISIDTSSVHELDLPKGGMAGALDPLQNLELENRKLKKQLKKSHKLLEDLEESHRMVSEEKVRLDQAVSNARREVTAMKVQSEQLLKAIAANENELALLKQQIQNDKAEQSKLGTDLRELKKQRDKEVSELTATIIKLSSKIDGQQYEIGQKEKRLQQYREHMMELESKQASNMELEKAIGQLCKAKEENEKLVHLNAQLEQELSEIKTSEIYEVTVDEKWVESRIAHTISKCEAEKNALKMQIEDLNKGLPLEKSELYQKNLFINEAKNWVAETRVNLQKTKQNVEDVNGEFEKEIDRAKKMKEIFFEMMEQKKNQVPECSSCQKYPDQPKSEKHIASVVDNVFDNEITRNEQYSLLQQEQTQYLNDSQMSVATPGVFQQKKKRKFYQIPYGQLLMFLVLSFLYFAYNFSIEYEDYYYQIVDSIFGAPDRILI